MFNDMQMHMSNHTVSLAQLPQQSSSIKSPDAIWTGIHGILAPSSRHIDALMPGSLECHKLDSWTGDKWGACCYFFICQRALGMPLNFSACM